MPIYAEVETALKVLDDVQKRMSGGRLDSSDPRNLTQVNNDLNTLLSVLSNPMFQTLCKIQDSVKDLGTQMVCHPSITTNDFEISNEGKLIIKISPEPDKYRPTFDKTPFDIKFKPVPSARSASSPPQVPSNVSKKFEEELELFPGALSSAPSFMLEEFEKTILKAALGRDVHKIRLCKPEGSSLGFSVVGLKSQEKGELGIFVQEIQPTGIAAKDGRLAEGDQILAIDGQPLDAAITHQQAIGILQQARGEVEIIVARAPDLLYPLEPLVPGDKIGAGQLPPSFLGGERPSSPPTEDSKGTDMVLNTEWAQVEVIELINDGTGLGFGIIGGRSTGVVVKTILPGGVADRDGRLQSGDHILQIGDVNLLGMGSEQVAAVLRQCGSCVRLVVARPIEPTSPDAFSQAPIVPTRILGDPEELERHLLQANGYGNGLMNEGSIGSGETGLRLGEEGGPSGFDSLPEVELVDVELKKDSHGLGITIAGYVCEKEELSGIFVKSISEGSAADLSARICINDRIVEVDGQSLQGFTNHQAVEVLRKTGPIVLLKLERYHHGTKYEQLQSAISHSEHKPPTPSSVSALSLPQVPVDSDGEGEEELLANTGIGEEEEEDEDEYEEERKDTRRVDMDLEDLEMLIDTRYDGEILAPVEAAILAKWGRIMGQDCEIVVSQLSKSKEGGGLGISLEGTVDVEDGREVRPHHYIRSILADGPVGLASMLLSGDELLEVNGRRLLGLNHVEVVSILKDLPMHVRIVCARRPGAPPPSRPIDTSQDRNAFAARNILGGSLQNLFQGSDRLVKAKSDGSLASTGTTAATETSFSKLKSRSLEPLTGLAMWSSEPVIIELPKGDRGLGFSILDYQDPMNPNETVIVIRSLVPGGVAQQDGRLIPGDRLLAVNESNLENATLDQAVQALKGAARGIVRIAVAKPLPLPDTPATISSVHSEDATPPPLPVSPPPAEISPKDRSRRSSNLSPLSPRTPSVLLDSMDSTLDIPFHVPVVPPPPRDLMLKTNEFDFSNQVTQLIPVATERLITSASSNGRSASTVTILSGSSVTSTTTTSTTILNQDQDSERSTPVITSGTTTTTTSTTSAEMSVSSSPLPGALEQTIKIMKLEEPLGVNVELVDEGVNGVMVTSTAVGGPFNRDGRIQAGDYLVAVNNESLRNVTNSQARAILRRAQLFSKELNVSFIPGGDAEVYRESLLIQQTQALSEESEAEERNRELGEETAEDLIVQRRRGSSGRDSQVDLGLKTPRRTPADGQESTEELLLGAGGGGLLIPPPAQSSSSSGTSPGSTIISRIPKSSSNGTPTPHKSTLNATLSQQSTPNSSISSSAIGYSVLDIIPSQATQPTVQKRVVTHVTIFPSPPPDLVQLTRTVPPPKPSPLVSPGDFQDKDKSESESHSISTSAATGTGTATDLEPKEEASAGSGSTSDKQHHSHPQVFTVVKKEPLKSTQSSVSISSGGGAGGLKKSLSRGHTLTPSSSVENNSLGAEMVVKEVSSASEEHTLSNSKGAGTSGGSGDESALLLAKHWGPERLVEVHREVGKSLGISIVGGKVDLYNAGPDSGSAISGIFIKNVLPNSPAGKTGQLKTGDRILAVDDVDLRSASHEKAVEVIRASGNPVRFLVQSLVQWGDGRGVSIANHDDSEGPSEKSEGTETKSQSNSQTVQSQSYSTGTTTETTSSTCTSRTRTTTETEGTAGPTSKTKTGTNGQTQRSRSGSSGSGETTSQIERKNSEKNGHDDGQSDGERGQDGDEEDENDVEDPELSSVHRAESPTNLLKVAPPPVAPARTPSPELIQAGLADEERQEIQEKMEAASKAGLKGKQSEDSDHSSEEDDELGDDRQLQGKTRTLQGVEIDRASAGNVKRSKADEALDTETEDEFGYTAKKIEKRWAEVAKNNENAKIVVAFLERAVGDGLGISLAGHKDRMKMATYICGINPAGLAHKTRQLEVGDEILEVNGTVLYGRCHLNASAMIKVLPGDKFKIVTLRKSEGLNELSVKPIVQFPVSLEQEAPEEKYATYKGLRVVTLKKIGGGLGIMIMEGRHAELGQGIFISDIQEGSPAEQAGLFVGDMILAVNGEDMVGSDYEHAANTLKKTEGNVALVVCNASKDDSKEKEKTKEEPPKKEPEKPRLPPKPLKILSPSKLISSVSSAISLRTKTFTLGSSSSSSSAPLTGSNSNTVTSPSSTLTLVPPVVIPQIQRPTTPPTTTTIIVPTSIGISTTSKSPTINTGATTPTPIIISPTTHPVPSVVVKPATPLPKLLPGISSAIPATKMALLVKNRLEEPPADPSTCPINPGKETTIEINKDKMGLGLSIVGGSDTLLGSIIIHEVYPDGAAAKDGRLKPGDQLLSVNNEDFQSITHSKALAALRQTPTKVKMLVYRDESVAKEDDMYDSIDVELVKKSGKGLGLSIVGRKNGSGVFISDVVPGGIAELHGGLMKGDMIISVNGVDLKTSTQEEAASVLKTAIGPIKMKIGRLKAAANRRSTSSTPATVPATPTSDNKNDLEEVEDEEEELIKVVNGSRNSNSSISNPPSLTGSPPQVKNIILERGPDGLGFSIVGGYGSPHGNLPIYVKTVFEKGAALISGLKRGDQIIAVNSTSCEGLTHQEAVTILKNVNENVALTILS